MEGLNKNYDDCHGSSNKKGKLLYSNEMNYETFNHKPNMESKFQLGHLVDDRFDEYMTG